MRAYILAYDIADAKRLRAMHKLAKSYGRPLQYSVFACLLRREDRVRLAFRIDGIINQQLDRVIVLDIGSVADRESWIPPLQIFGRQKVSTQKSAVIV